MMGDIYCEGCGMLLDEPSQNDEPGAIVPTWDNDRPFCGPKCCRETKEYEQYRADVEAERASWDCAARGHSWEYFYGHRSRCRHCNA
jgi:hypothetical protein